MKVKTLPALLLAGLCSTSALACDKVDAAKVQFIFFEMGAEWSEQPGRVRLDWGPAWDGAAPRQRAALLQAFADGDACLSGRAREVVSYRKGKLVGRASPGTGLQLLDESPRVAAARPMQPGTAATAADCPR